VDRALGVAGGRLCGGCFLILHVEDRRIYVVEDVADGVVTVLVTINGVGFVNGRAL
jgi:hypothetical protein